MTYPSSQTRRDAYQEITDQIIAAIEDGAGDWRMPWIAHNGGMPTNATTKAGYRGINILSLWLAGRDYPHALWASYQQWHEAGAQVRKGERGTMIVFYRDLTREVRDPSTGETSEERFPMLKYSHVFNIAQVDGATVPTAAMPNLAQRLAGAEQFVSGTGAAIRYGMARAFYAPGPDQICMPEWGAFIDTPSATATENAYGTLLHELTHWTGHKSRLERDLCKRFGSDAYAAEELVAELGAAFLCGTIGITSAPRLDHAQYLTQWLALLRADKRAIFTAASKAAAAVDYLNSLHAASARQAA